MRGEVRAESKRQMTGRIKTKASQSGREAVLGQGTPQLGSVHTHRDK